MANFSLDNKQIEQLVQEAQNGDVEAFGKLYDLYVDPLYRYIFFRIGKEDALDMTENVFLKVWQSLKSYKVGSFRFSAWIFRIAHNAVVDFYRLHKQDLPLDFDLPETKRSHDPIALTEQKLSQEVLQKAMAKLSKKYQQIITLKYINELDNEEIARILNRSEGSLRILKFRALKALKKILVSMNIHY